MWRKPWFLSQGPVLGAPCRCIMLATDASLTGWSGHSPTTHWWTTQAGAPDPCVVPGQTPLAESSAYSWVSQYGNRNPVDAGAEALPRGDEADMESFWPGPGGSACNSDDIALSPLVLSDSSSSTGAGYHGTDLPEASSVCLFYDRSAPGSSRESAPGRGLSISSRPVLAGPSMVLGPDFSPQCLSIEISVRRDLLSQAEGMIFHTRPEFWKLCVHNS